MGREIVRRIERVVEERGVEYVGRGFTIRESGDNNDKEN